LVLVKIWKDNGFGLTSIVQSESLASEAEATLRKAMWIRLESFTNKQLRQRLAGLKQLDVSKGNGHLVNLCRERSLMWYKALIMSKAKQLA